MTTAKKLGSRPMFSAAYALLTAAMWLIVVVTPANAQDVVIAADRPCADARGTLGAAFDIQGDNNGRSWYWVGLYRNQDITRDRARPGEAFLRGEPELWVSSLLHSASIFSRTNE